MSARSCTDLTTMRNFFAVLAGLAIVSWASVAAAQGPGVRGGVSIDPDQFYFGAHYETDALVDRVHFRPNVEAGLGDDLTTIALNFDFVYKFPQRNSWRLYAGGGPAVNFYRFDRPGDDETESEPGLNFLLGVESDAGLFFEFKIGAIDSPELKFGVGWSFR
jgi:hypothetical protein